LIFFSTRRFKTMKELDDIIDQVSDYLRYKAESGERTTELERGTIALLRGTAAPAAPSSRAVKAQIPDSKSQIAQGQAAAERTRTQVPDSKPQIPQGQAAAGRTQVPDSKAQITQGQKDIGDVDGVLAAIASECAACRLCELVNGRNKVVPGQGNPNRPPIMFIGEAPGADEDAQGLAFVGRAGQLLTKMIAAMGYTRDEVFIANICKCRPPNNRTPTPAEMAACLPFLKRQIAAVRPRFIVALGNTAIQGLLGETGILRIHGNWREFEGIPLMPTFHPAYLLRCPPAKRGCWEDLKLVMARLKE
jgi:DNA polymerase